MDAVRAHYDDLLGPIYAWMIGDLDAAIAAARADLRAAGIVARECGTAVDLGAGLGAHAVALAEAGYAVTAIDTCAPLLDALRERAGGLAIAIVQDDLLELGRHGPAPLDVVLCMGDTLTHLASIAAVEQLFDLVTRVLGPEGVFVATFRDYSGPPRTGVARFIPVRQDDQRILTCFLEYTDTTVLVHDLVHERTAEGWTLRVSRYPKLRLDPQWVCAALGDRGLVARLEPGASGMVRLVAARP